MKGKTIDIRPCTSDHQDRYAAIYAKAFSGKPWNDPWTVDDAVIHVGELLDSRQSYGLECVVDGEVAGFLFGTSMLFHYGRTLEINDLAVAPQYQRAGIATNLIERCLQDMKARGIVAVHLITATEGVLTGFYEHFGFTAEKQVMLMGKEL